MLNSEKFIFEEIPDDVEYDCIRFSKFLMHRFPIHKIARCLENVLLARHAWPSKAHCRWPKLALDPKRNWLRGDQVTLLRGKGGVHGEFTGLSLVIGHLDDPIALEGRNVVTLAQHDLLRCLFRVDAVADMTPVGADQLHVGIDVQAGQLQ